MRIEDKLEKMKKVYLNTPVSDEVMIKEWNILENVLGEQQNKYYSPLLYRSFAFLVIFFLLSGGVVSLAQASKPGELLYPVKILSRNVVKKIKQETPVVTSETVIPTVTPTSTVTPTGKPATKKIIRQHGDDENEFEREDEREDVHGISDKKKINSERVEDERTSNSELKHEKKDQSRDDD